jgi:hypothetical protein
LEDINVIKNKFALVLLCLINLIIGLGPADAATDLDVTILPEHIQMGANYNGQQISVAGRIPSDAAALIRVTGEEEHYKLKQKGRALGVLWMNLDSVEISGVPGVFLLYLPEQSDALRPNGHPVWQTLGLGLEGVRKQAHIIAKDANKEALFDEFVKLKQKSRLYGVAADAVHYGSDDGQMKSFNVILEMPSALPQGKYRIEVFAIKNGAIQASVTREIDAAEVGMPAWIASLAFNHGTLYGVFAVLVAVIAGLATGIMFKGGKGAH